MAGDAIDMADPASVGRCHEPGGVDDGWFGSTATSSFTVVQVLPSPRRRRSFFGPGSAGPAILNPACRPQIKGR